MQKSENSSTDLRTQPCHFACSLACMQSDMVGGMLLPAKAGRCACGFSGLQINILSILKAQHEVISYWQIAILVQSVFGQSTSEDAVRGALGRLYRHGFLVRQRANRAHLKGNRYAFTADPCPHIKAYSTVESARQQPVQSPAQSSQASPPSILEEKDKRNTLSISSQRKTDPNWRR